jgi:GNAT superfamily N-acetyltransferase
MLPSPHLRPADPEQDFGQLAAWFSLLEEDASSEQGLREYYARRRERILQQVAEDARGLLLGFYWAYRKTVEDFIMDLFVDPVARLQGIGRLLYGHAEHSTRAAGAKTVQVTVQDGDPASRAFAERRGFEERWHMLPMTLDLETFDDRPYDALLARLQGEGFRFTSLEAEGNTEESQRRLYVLNDTTDADVPGCNGEHSWGSFEDFRDRVCRSDWFRPGGRWSRSTRPAANGSP